VHDVRPQLAQPLPQTRDVAGRRPHRVQPDAGRCHGVFARIPGGDGQRQHLDVGAGPPQHIHERTVLAEQGVDVDVVDEGGDQTGQCELGPGATGDVIEDHDPQPAQRPPSRSVRTTPIGLSG
jgi:hypothetical protein